MVHAPEITDYVKDAAHKLDVVSDEVDAVNVLKLQNKEAAAAAAAAEFDAQSKFDAEKDKTAFRQYEDACDRVKNFYAVSVACCCWWQGRVVQRDRQGQSRPVPGYMTTSPCGSFTMWHGRFPHNRFLGGLFCPNPPHRHLPAPPPTPTR